MSISTECANVATELTCSDNDCPCAPGAIGCLGYNNAPNIVDLAGTAGVPLYITLGKAGWKERIKLDIGQVFPRRRDQGER